MAAAQCTTALPDCPRSSQADRSRDPAPVFLRVIATDPRDRTRAQRTRREFFCNRAEADVLRPRLVAAGYVVTEHPEHPLD